MRDRIVQVSAAVVIVALLVAVIWSLRTPDRPEAGTEPAGSQAGEQTVALDDVDELSDVIGDRVLAREADVESVPGDEGFWVATGGDPAWVQLATAGESPFTVEPGDRISFTGEVVAHGADFAERPEFSEADARELVDAGAHIEVPVGAVTLTG